MKAWPPDQTPRRAEATASRRSDPGIRGPGASPIDPDLPAPIRTREAQRPDFRPAVGDAGAFGRAALLRLAASPSLADPLAPSAHRFAARHGVSVNPAPLLAHWQMRTIGHPGTEREYPWVLPFDAAPGSPDYEFREEVGRLWRPREIDAFLRDPTDYGRRLLSPIALTEALEFLAGLVGDDDAQVSEVADRLLADVRPRAERDVSGYVQGDDPWRDTLALWLLSSRPRALEMLHPLAMAIATRYATLANRMAGLVCGVRYPFDGTPLVSASAHLGLGLWSLGVHPRLLPGLLRFVSDARTRLGGWADDGQPEDVMTTLAAADLLTHLDPAFDPEPTTDFLARLQEPSGWWRALDPEVPWLTGAVVEWLERASLPFHERFRWPGYQRWDRDRRTRLPWWAAFGDVLVRTFERVPGLAAARVEAAFIDLAGFGTFNSRFGQSRGDDVLRYFARELAAVPFAQALRDGGDEFVLVGAPTHDGLDRGLERFLREWPGRFRTVFPDATPVVPRIVIAEATGATIAHARERLGEEIAAVKVAHAEPGPEGVLVRIRV
jgi:GGDEF domain-containing protein